ncbi:DUF397 domain-containing protein [Streptomyces calidiresistens]|uniref:DUF397 domain-containing protein n=1 Tax=Streptomyces calidiresistens TaxID=1485586 RepID=A0A7W3T547_9ACTN|nr:DUF397 domain-containing protein [Streptomyces calidiresistens]MBB0231120.1 DUF397 domain-containing protein [Streptomyces calidiresistens]
MAIQQGQQGRQDPTRRWIKSSHSGGNGACVEVLSPATSALLVRDSKTPGGPRLAFPAASWTAFVDTVPGAGTPGAPDRD